MSGAAAAARRLLALRPLSPRIAPPSRAATVHATALPRTHQSQPRGMMLGHNGQQAGPGGFAAGKRPSWPPPPTMTSSSGASGGGGGGGGGSGGGGGFGFRGGLLGLLGAAAGMGCFGCLALAEPRRVKGQGKKGAMEQGGKGQAPSSEDSGRGEEEEEEEEGEDCQQPRRNNGHNGRWNDNWDRRGGQAKSGGARYLVLVRHGQYESETGALTDLGR